MFVPSLSWQLIAFHEKTARQKKAFLRTWHHLTAHLSHAARGHWGQSQSISARVFRKLELLRSFRFKLFVWKVTRVAVVQGNATQRN
jgi:hypothetical protein